MDIGPLEIPDEDPLEIRPVMDAVMREEFEPRSNMFPHTYWEVLNDEVVIIHSSGSAGETEVFQPYTGICLPGIFGDVGRRSEALWERHFLDVSAKGPWSRAIQAGTPAIRSATMPGVHFTAPLDGSAGAHVTCPHRRSVDVIIMMGVMPVADDTTSVLVRTEPLAYQRSVWSRCLVRPWGSRCLPSHAWRL